VSAAGGIPSFEQNKALQVLRLDSNKLTGTPTMITTPVIVVDELFAGNVPNSLKSLSQLSFLALYTNQLEIPPQAPLYSGGHMFYNNREAVASFLEVL
jgi:hypothetical protein